MHNKMYQQVRSRIIDGLQKLCQKLGLSKSTYVLSIDLIDKYVNKQDQIADRQLDYELLACSCLLLAAKSYEIDYFIPQINKILQQGNFTYSNKEIIDQEMKVLEVFGFKTTNHLTIYDIFEYFSNQILLFRTDSLNKQNIKDIIELDNSYNQNMMINNSKDLLVMIDKMKSLGYKIMLEIIKELRFIELDYNMVCLSIICIVRKYFQVQPIWNHNQEMFSGFSYQQLQDIFELIDCRFGNDIKTYFDNFKQNMKLQKESAKKQEGKVRQSQLQNKQELLNTSNQDNLKSSDLNINININQNININYPKQQGSNNEAQNVRKQSSNLNHSVADRSLNQTQSLNNNYKMNGELSDPKFTYNNLHQASSIHFYQKMNQQSSERFISNYVMTKDSILYQQPSKILNKKVNETNYPSQNINYHHNVDILDTLIKSQNSVQYKSKNNLITGNKILYTDQSNQTIKNALLLNKSNTQNYQPIKNSVFVRNVQTAGFSTVYQQNSSYHQVYQQQYYPVTKMQNSHQKPINHQMIQSQESYTRYQTSSNNRPHQHFHFI